MFDFKKENLRAFVSVTNIALLLGLIVQQAKWQEKIDMKVKNLETHVNSEVMHMPFAEKTKYFVPRIEIDGRLMRIEIDLDEIKKDIKEISKRK